MKNKAAAAAAIIMAMAATGAAAQEPKAEKVSDSRAVLSAGGAEYTIDFWGQNTVRIFSGKGEPPAAPQGNPPATIIPAGHKPTGKIREVRRSEGGVQAATDSVTVALAEDGNLSVTLANGSQVMATAQPPYTEAGAWHLKIAMQPGEQAYGGGVQNGRFSHRGKAIDIVNTNTWTDGGVASPCPFYWTTAGYGIMAHTFKPGRYDFAAEKPGVAHITHQDSTLDIFVFATQASRQTLIKKYLELTGMPPLLPKFGYYEGHLNAYNRDYWVEDPDGIPFEDGKKYKESQKDNGGTRETLNGENGSYQFSARAVVDRYAAHDMPLGWILPNDGYGAGYGQTPTLEGNVANLKEFGDYARSKGVEIGLWTQSALHPDTTVEALLQRDLASEVGTAGVRVLKTDVAWVGAGYSFGLNGIDDASPIMVKESKGARPFIISLDGWAGTQRAAGIWTGDQTGGNWEYIRFHIPTYLSAGLSGMSSVTSDMDGIFGGKNPIVNAREFQWKAFTPMQLNMDGWGANPKYPQAMGEPWTSINRSWLKLKSRLLPYAYSIAYEALEGMPVMRPMMMQHYNGHTCTEATRYQYMYGPSLLVAPIYKDTQADSLGNDIRDNIYLPDGLWYDYITGECVPGGRIVNNYPAPRWKTPVFVKAGAIIPMAKPTNNPAELDPTERIFDIWPAEGSHSFTLLDDDGKTMEYASGKTAATKVESSMAGGVLHIKVSPTEGDFDGFQPAQRTIFTINVGAEPKTPILKIGGKKRKLKKVGSTAEAMATPGTWCYDPAPELNLHATPGTEWAKVEIKRGMPQVVVHAPEADTRTQGVELYVKKAAMETEDWLLSKEGALSAPKFAQHGSTPYTISPKWEMDGNADYYEIRHGGQLLSSITQDHLTIEDLAPNTEYEIDLRAVNASGASEWSHTNIKTLEDPYKEAIRGITAKHTGKDQPGQGVARLFDLDKGGDAWHTEYGKPVGEIDLTIDLHATAQLDKMEYTPRNDAGNGTIEKLTVQTSIDGKEWTAPEEHSWQRDNTEKAVTFGGVSARYIRLHIAKAVGGYASGQELVVYKQPGTQVQKVGDINRDGRLDEDDLTSYLNYMGLAKGDPDFDGYVSGGDTDLDGAITAIDAAYPAAAIDKPAPAPLKGTVKAAWDKKQYKKGETMTLTWVADGLEAYAISAKVGYDAKAMEFLSGKLLISADARNLTADRLHAGGQKAAYPCYIFKQGNTAANGQLMQVTFKALKDQKAPAAPTEWHATGSEM